MAALEGICSELSDFIPGFSSITVSHDEINFLHVKIGKIVEGSFTNLF